MEMLGIYREINIIFNIIWWEKRVHIENDTLSLLVSNLMWQTTQVYSNSNFILKYVFLCQNYNKTKHNVKKFITFIEEHIYHTFHKLNSLYETLIKSYYFDLNYKLLN